MDRFKNPETYQKLKALGIVDINPTELSGDELSHHLSHRLFNYEFTADELDNPLEQERRLHLQDAVNTAVVIAATHGRYDDKTRTEMELSRIRSLSSLLLSSTRLKDMEASKAKAYREGHGSHEKHFSDTLRNVKLQSKSSSTEPISYSYEGVPVYYVCSPDRPCHDYPLLDTDLPQRTVDTCCNIANRWRTLPGWLGVDKITEGMPQAVFDAFGKVTSHLESPERNGCCRANVYAGNCPVQSFDRADDRRHHSAGHPSRDD